MTRTLVIPVICAKLPAFVGTPSIWQPTRITLLIRAIGVCLPCSPLALTPGFVFLRRHRQRYGPAAGSSGGQGEFCFFFGAVSVS